ncbi:MAG: hypothetical protein JNK05_27955 [Myxococcales bacterium]|nr:hypothetical protein [Myxococcales bacterium]
MRRNTRWITFGTLLTLGATSCAPGEGDLGPLSGENATEDPTEGTTVDAVTDLTHTTVKRQSIGNCWIYATTGWIESMRAKYTRTTANPAGEQLNISESWITYWHWYKHLTDGSTSTEIETGGFWGEAGDLIIARGWMSEGDFIPEEANSEISQRQSSALNAINASLRSGMLSNPMNRRNGMIVRQELNRAFGLRQEIIAEMDTVFGADGARTLENARATRRFIKRPTELIVGSARTSTGSTRRLHLGDVFGRANGYWNPDLRSGTYAWRSISYPSDMAGRTRFWQRVMKAMNDGHPVIVSWLVDFNALDSEGNFKLTQLTTPGRQGGHLTVTEDYTVDNVPGFGTLGLGMLSAEQRNAALQGTIRFLRIKNSWGTDRPDRASHNGYYDLYLDYMNGPIRWKTSEEPNAPTRPQTPLDQAIIPPGY